jgi:hypothetical protein
VRASARPSLAIADSPNHRARDGKQPGIGGNDRTAKLEHQAAVKIEPNSIRFRFPVGFAVAASRSIHEKPLIVIFTPKLSALSGECGPG